MAQICKNCLGLVFLVASSARYLRFWGIFLYSAACASPCLVVDTLLQVDIVCGTPGRLDDLISTGNLDLSQVRFFVLDEAVSTKSIGVQYAGRYFTAVFLGHTNIIQSKWDE